MRTGLKVTVSHEGRQSVRPADVVAELRRRGEFGRLARWQQRLRQNQEPASEPLHGRLWLDSERTVRCAEGDCPALYQADGQGCPRCGSHQAVPVARAINGTKPEPEAT